MKPSLIALPVGAAALLVLVDAAVLVDALDDVVLADVALVAAGLLPVELELLELLPHAASTTAIAANAITAATARPF